MNQNCEFKKIANGEDIYVVNFVSLIQQKLCRRRWLGDLGIQGGSNAAQSDPCMPNRISKAVIFELFPSNPQLQPLPSTIPIFLGHSLRFSFHCNARLNSSNSTVEFL